MATFNSDQYTLTQKAIPSKVSSNQWGGRLRRQYFTITLPAAGLATGDIINLGKLPPKSRILGGQFNWGTAQGITATTAVGTVASSGRYFAAAVTNSLAVVRIADTAAQNFGDELAAETLLIVTNAAAAWTASSVLQVIVDYIVD